VTERPSTSQELRALTRLGAPVAATQIGMMLLGVVDTMMLGELGVFELDAAALGNIWLYGTFIFGIGLVLGIDPIVTQAWGAKDTARVGRGLQWGLLIALAASVPIGASWSFTEEFLRLSGQTPELSAAAERYVAAQIWSLPFLLMFQALRQYLQAMNVVAPGVWVVALANVVNVLANWALIFGHLGVDPMGFDGAALATAGTRLFMFVALAGFVAITRIHHRARPIWDRGAFDPAGLRETVRHGLPIALQYGLEGWAFQITGLMAGWLGETQLAAHAIVLNLASLSFMLALGVSIGAATRVGNLIGARRWNDAQHASWVAFALGAAAMVTSGVLFIVARHWLPTLYTDDAATIAASAAILPIAAAFQVFDGLQVVGGGILRGMGKPRPAAAFNLVAYYWLALPLAWFLGFDALLGLPGLWWSLCTGLGIVALCLLAWVRYRGPRWLGATSPPA
jgi:MATE family multidrug resistance protein